MNFAEKRWNLHRLMTDRLGWQPPFSRGTNIRKILFLGERDPICHMQSYPFWHYRKALRERHGVEFREMTLQGFLEGRCRYREVDAVCFQTWFDLTPEAVRSVATRIRQSFPGARLAYFDWFAPTDLRFAEPLNDLVQLYVKKQVLRNRGEYGKPTLGDTNLTDYYARRFQLEGYTETQFVIPDSFWPKLWIGTHFAISPHMVPRFLGELPTKERDIDLHARIAVKGTPWYTRMRQEALDKALQLSQRLTVVCQGRVDRNAYFEELHRSKLCFSPFGYGEVCWRDFEAMFTGSLLLKPDMSHLDCAPEAFFPRDTYVPLAWDLSDLEEKVDYYLEHESERLAITRRAFACMADYFRQDRFLDEVRPFLQRLSLLGG